MISKIGKNLLTFSRKVDEIVENLGLRVTFK